MLCAALPPAVGQRQHRDGEALGARRSSEPSAGPDADTQRRQGDWSCFESFPPTLFPHFRATYIHSLTVSGERMYVLGLGIFEYVPSAHRLLANWIDWI